MLIRKIENRLAEEEYVDRYVNQLKKTMERLQREIDAIYAKCSREGHWSQADIAKYNRKEKLQRQIRATINSYRQSFHRDLRDDLANLYTDEARYVQGLLRGTPNLDIAYDELTNLPTTAVKSEVVDVVTIKGKTMRDYVSKYGVDLAFRVEQEVFESIALGENPKKTARRLRDLEQAMMGRVEMTTRSWTNAIYNQSNLEVYEQAEIKKVRYLATLDMRTCPECAADHNQVFVLGEQPFLPRHPNCRCAYSPFISSALTPPADGYEGWILDGRRSEEQLRELLARIKGFRRRGRISNDEAAMLTGYVGQALSRVA